MVAISDNDLADDAEIQCRYIAGVMVISESLVFVIEWFLLTRSVKPEWHFEQDFIWNSFVIARTFLAIEAVGALSVRIEVLLLSMLGDEVLVGLYGGITQLIQPFDLVAYNIALAFSPTISRLRGSAPGKQRQTTESFIEMLMFVALPFSVVLLFLGKN